MLDTQQVSTLLFWATFLGASALVAALTHYAIRSMWGANLLTVIAVVFGLVAINTVHLGYFDGWLIIAVPIAGTIVAVVSFCVGALLDQLGVSRRKRCAKHVA
jgi:peptidoglycan/LPS O-acetylase OafA/YrhL